MRALVTGGRWWQQRERTFAFLDSIHEISPIRLLIHGDATGADTLCKEWAESRGIPTEAHPVTKADWRKYGKAAGCLRNQAMLDQNPDILIAFPGGSGTKDMLTRAKKTSLQIVEFESE